MELELRIQCEHGKWRAHYLPDDEGLCHGKSTFSSPKDVLAALVKAGVLEVDRHPVSAQRTLVMHYTPWKEDT